MKMKRHEQLENVGFDMTPMIDCVFQLIIFFMLSTDFANTQLERVQLPKATTAVEDKSPPETRLMINLAHVGPGAETCKELKYNQENKLIKACSVEKHWQIKVGNKKFEPSELEQLLSLEGSKPPGREPSPDGGKSLGLSKRTLQIRSDAGAVYQMLEKVFAASARARIWKIEIGASQPPKD
jgi:biopolymer transport protein ExbD